MNSERRDIRYKIRTLHNLKQRLSRCHEKLLSNILSKQENKKNNRLIKHLEKKISDLESQGPFFLETYKSIIHAPANLIICHCVAADLRMSRGAAKDLSDLYPKIREVIGEPTVGSCLPSFSNERTFLNLITKHNSSDKPETSHFEQCIKNLKAYTDANKIDRIAITRLGCGLDLLSWDQYVWPLLAETYKDTPFSFYVYTL